VRSPTVMTDDATGHRYSMEAPMQCSVSTVCRSLAIAAGMTVAVAACSDNSTTTPTLPTAYVETKLVADDASLGATLVDPNLVNAWGIAFSSGGTLWVSDNATTLDAVQRYRWKALAGRHHSPGGWIAGRKANRAGIQLDHRLPDQRRPKGRVHLRRRGRYDLRVELRNGRSDRGRSLGRRCRI
jgi:hypothetical protein